MPLERRQHGVGDASHANLERRSVGNHLGDVVADAPLGIARHGRRHLDQRVVDLDGGGQLRDVNHGVAVGEGHCLVDLADERVGALGGRDGQVGRDSERAVALLVGLREVEQRHVDRQRSVAEHGGNFAQEGGDALSVALGEPAADVVGHEEAVDQEALPVLGLAVGGVEGTHGEGRVDLHVGELPGAVGHGADQRFGNRGAPLDVDAAVGLDEAHRLGGCRVFHADGFLLLCVLRV